jgi:MFS family permease
MLIAFGVGIYMGGILDGALTLKLNNVRIVKQSLNLDIVLTACIQRYGLDSKGAGLVFMANAIPAFICSPLAGYLTDKYGQRLIGIISLVGTCIVLPFLCIDRMNLAAFCAVLALAGRQFQYISLSSGTNSAILDRWSHRYTDASNQCGSRCDYQRDARFGICTFLQVSLALLSHRDFD